MVTAASFGPYELVRRLGAGGMAETFLAVRRGPGGFEQQLCLKRILPALEEDPTFVDQFLDEARLAAQLQHANITQVVDFGVVEGQHYLALQLVEGMDLRALLAAFRRVGLALDPELTSLVAMELASALDFAHTPHGGRPTVIHRDVTPSNVLISRVGEIYLSDFGIARALGDQTRTASGVIKGKVPYLAPEYVFGGGPVDARVDLFALGVILFECLTGRRPYEADDDVALLEAARRGVHPPLGTLCPSAPPQLVAIVERLLKPTPTARYASAADVLEALVHVPPRPIAPKRLGEMVRTYAKADAPLDVGEILSEPPPEPTLSVSRQPAPIPSVIPAAPDAETRTRDRGSRPSDSQPGPWAATDASRLAPHRRLSSPEGPAARPSTPRSGGFSLGVLGAAGATAFAVAAALGYVVVSVLLG